MKSAYVVVNAIPYEQPDIIAVWLSEDAANAHKDSLESEWGSARSHLIAPGLPPFAVWIVPLEPGSPQMVDEMGDLLWRRVFDARGNAEAHVPPMLATTLETLLRQAHVPEPPRGN